MFVSNAIINQLKEKLINNGQNIERIILHEIGSKNLQFMCIAFKKDTRYPPIADKEDGFISFVVLEGKLLINTYDINKKTKINSQLIHPKEIYKIPRYLYRETISSEAKLSILIFKIFALLLIISDNVLLS